MVGAGNKDVGAPASLSTQDIIKSSGSQAGQYPITVFLVMRGSQAWRYGGMRAQRRLRTDQRLQLSKAARSERLISP
jgi:hypothetical protein